MSWIKLRRPDMVRVHQAAVFYVAAELSRRDLETELGPEKSGVDLIVRRHRGDEILVRVKGKTAASWQAPIDLPRLKGKSRRLVVFVDLDPRTALTPGYWVARERWVLSDITRHHRAYLARHGGKRPRSPKSTHSKISADRLLKWRDRWELFTEKESAD